MKYNSIISTTILNEDQYLDEWVKYHLGIGVEHIVIYDNKSNPPQENRWGKKVTVIRDEREWESSPTDNCHNDTLKNFNTNWIVHIDIDEFVVLKQHEDINEFLEPYKDFGGVGINWRVFGTSGHKTKPAGGVIENYVWRIPDDCLIMNGGNSHVKTIIRSEFCKSIPDAHICYSSRPLVNEDFVPHEGPWTNSSRIKSVINHYVSKSEQEWIEKFNLYRKKYGTWRDIAKLKELDENCTVFDDYLKQKIYGYT